MEHALPEYIQLFVLVFLAGFIDSIAGGGGLIQIPALIFFAPQAPLAMLLGTNKVSSVFGTAFAMVQYIRKTSVDWKSVMPGAFSAFVFSFIGAKTVTIISNDFLKPLVLVMLVVIAIYTFMNKDFGSVARHKLGSRSQLAYGILLGGAVGFYDGFFGPGTGSFLIFMFISIYGYDFLHASACSKIINVSTNIAAILYFGIAGCVYWKLGLAMAVFNVAGSYAGSKMAIDRGNKFIRVIFLAILAAIIARLVYVSYLK
ncbi:MAG TPA: hypothetical protein DCZ94_22330 [Lentisphaeria bacterium]|nr:MAG: hypothetical protein A2X48_13570 [Lentisphaerae bacterium GWF2_49_21]HBC89686.1 hypothetical protein [Lentisphaeria bacterium]